MPYHMRGANALNNKANMNLPDLMEKEQLRKVEATIKSYGSVPYEQLRTELKANGVPFGPFKIIVKYLKRVGLVEEKRHNKVPTHTLAYITPFIDDAVPYGTLPQETTI